MHTLGLYLTPLNKDPEPLNTELLEHFENRVWKEEYGVEAHL